MVWFVLTQFEQVWISQYVPNPDFFVFMIIQEMGMAWVLLSKILLYESHLLSVFLHLILITMPSWLVGIVSKLSNCRSFVFLYFRTQFIEIEYQSFLHFIRKGESLKLSTNPFYTLSKKDDSQKLTQKKWTNCRKSTLTFLQKWWFIKVAQNKGLFEVDRGLMLANDNSSKSLENTGSLKLLENNYSK